MIQPGRKYPFKKLEMGINYLGKGKNEYVVFENGRKLCSRIEFYDTYIACYVMKNFGIYPYKIVHLFRDIETIGMNVPRAYPYAVGFLSSVEITDQQFNYHSKIMKYFLPKISKPTENKKNL